MDLKQIITILIIQKIHELSQKLLRNSWLNSNKMDIQMKGIEIHYLYYF